MKYPEWKDMQSDPYAGSFIGQPGLPMIDSETPTFMARPLAKSPRDLEGADVVIIGTDYVAGADEFGGVARETWALGPKRVRQQSAGYHSGYIQDLDLDVFEHLNVVDYGNAETPAEVIINPTAENVRKAQENVEAKVRDALAVGAIPIVLGQNSPCSSFAIAKQVSEHTTGLCGMVSLDAHWDAGHTDPMTGDPTIAGAINWKRATYEQLSNFRPEHLVEIGERGMMERKETVRGFVEQGAHFFPMWKVRTELGIDGLCREMRHAYEGTSAVYAHFDMDVLGGEGPASGDIFADIAEPMGMNDYEVLRLAHEVGRRGFDGMSFICIPPNSIVMYRLIVYVVMFLLAGLAQGGLGRRGNA